MIFGRKKKKRLVIIGLDGVPYRLIEDKGYALDSCNHNI